MESTGTGRGGPGPERAEPAGDAGARLPAAVAGDLLRQCLSIQGECSAQVVSGSMSPVLCRGDTVFVCPLAKHRARPGDLLLVSAGDALVTHRVVALTGSGILLKGDRNTLPDAHVADDDVIGRVHSVRRKSGSVFRLDGPAVRTASLVTAVVSGWAGALELRARRGQSLLASLAARGLRGLLRVCVLGLRAACFVARGLPATKKRTCKGIE